MRFPLSPLKCEWDFPILQFQLQFTLVSHIIETETETFDIFIFNFSYSRSPMNFSPQGIPNVIIELHNCAILLTLYFSYLLIFTRQQKFWYSQKSSLSPHLADYKISGFSTSALNHRRELADLTLKLGSEIKVLKKRKNIIEVVWRWERSWNGFFFC